MIEKLREILGLLSGYKQKYDANKAELDGVKAVIAEAEPKVNLILTILKGWDGPDNKAQ